MRILTQTPQTHAENDVSRTQTTLTYTDFAIRFALAASGMCTLGAADKLRAFCDAAYSVSPVSSVCQIKDTL